MPIYEFFCQECNTIYKFFSRTIDTETVPRCPSCKKNTLEKQFSAFATISSTSDDDTDGGLPPGMDESKVEEAVAMLAKEGGKIDQDDPRQSADLMRKLADVTGMPLGPGMQEALSRIESGEDPQKIQQELGDVIKDETLNFEAQHQDRKTEIENKPKFDDNLYEM